MERGTKISCNSAGLVCPSGEVVGREQSNTYNSIKGVGHEDWFFRNEGGIDGWRHAFIQCVSKGRKAVVKLQQPFDLPLFSVEPGKRRRYVAHIREADALGDQQADAAARSFRDMLRGTFPGVR